LKLWTGAGSSGSLYAASACACALPTLPPHPRSRHCSFLAFLIKHGDGDLARLLTHITALRTTPRLGMLTLVCAATTHTLSDPERAPRLRAPAILSAHSISFALSRPAFLAGMLVLAAGDATRLRRNGDAERRRGQASWEDPWHGTHTPSDRFREWKPRYGGAGVSSACTHVSTSLVTRRMLYASFAPPLCTPRFSPQKPP